MRPAALALLLIAALLTGCEQLPTVPPSTINNGDPEASIRFAAAPGQYELFFTPIGVDSGDAAWNADLSLKMIKAQPSDRWQASMKLCVTSYPDSPDPSACLMFVRKEMGTNFETRILTHVVGADMKTVEAPVGLPSDGMIQVRVSVRGQTALLMLNGREVFQGNLGNRPKYLAFQCASSICEIRKLQATFE